MMSPQLKLIALDADDLAVISTHVQDARVQPSDIIWRQGEKRLVVGMSEERYRHLTYDITLAAATTLARLNPQMTFTYVTGAGTDSTEQGSRMWARVKGKTENDLLKLPFKAAFMFRPGVIQPLHGVRSKTAWVQTVYDVSWPLWAVLRRLTPRLVTSTEQIGRGMIRVAREGYPRKVLEMGDINSL